MSHLVLTGRCAFRHLLLATLVGTLALGHCTTGNADQESEQFFESHVRPLLVKRCSRCHGAKKQEGGLRVDSRQAMLKEGTTGNWVVPGDPAQSGVIRAVRHQGDITMPPDERLSDREVSHLEKWVSLGAPWPNARPSAPVERHWAFHPVAQDEPPPVSASGWVGNPIDAFVLARIEAMGLSNHKRADRRTLIRRVSYALTGLPPSAAEVAAFESSPDVDAYARLVDRLLSSPAYGEHWARRWLDVARYSDTKGYVYAREERFWVHAWSYRDWVQRALNQDLRYDRFLLFQLAADQVPGCDASDLVALGFLTIGRRFLGVKRDIIDDRIDVVCRGTMGLTVACARCHDHKYDPIPTADYYSLYGVFDSCAEELVRLKAEDSPSSEFENELQTRQRAYETTLASERAESAKRARDRVVDYLAAQTELDKYPAAGFDQIFQKSDLLPAFVRRWQSYLLHAGEERDPVFVPWHAYARLSPDDYAHEAVSIHQRLAAAPPGTVNPLVARKFTTPPASFGEVVDRYGELFEEIDERWTRLLGSATGGETPAKLDSSAAESLRQILYSPTGPCAIPAESMVHIETFFDSKTCETLWKLQGEVDRWIVQSKEEVPFALTMRDRQVASTPRIFRRGNPLNLGDEVPRHFLSALQGGRPRPFESGSGRLELAEAIIDPVNPLTARVIVNRVWAHHFGSGLVPTTSDFGTRAELPSHPKLLDWLAHRFVADGWSLKQLHRLILLSETYRQSSVVDADSADHLKAARIDPDNRLLWRTRQRRLSFEELRDSLLVASGVIDRRMNGKPAQLFKPPFPQRRTLYGLIDRQFLPGTLRIFDFANPDLHVPRRSETTVPQQALFFLNHSIVLSNARALAERTRRDSTEQSIQLLFQRVYQRMPSDAELQEARRFVKSAAEDAAISVSPTTPAEQTNPSVEQLDAWEQLAHVLLCSNEFSFVD